LNTSELKEIIRNGENSGVECKRDDILPEKLAKEMAALLNLEGGYIFLGIEEDGSVSGLSRPAQKAEEWVMETARVHLRPATIPYWEIVEWEDGKVVGIISLPEDGPDKPYKAKRGSAWVTQVRVGTTTRDATNEEEARLYQQSGRLQYDRKPVPGGTFESLDSRRLINYFRDIRKQEYPNVDDIESWQRLLVNTELMTEDRGKVIPSVGGLLLFGKESKRFLPQAGISAAAYPGEEKDYSAKERTYFDGPVVSLFSEKEDVLERGIIEQAMDFVRRNISIDAWIEMDARRHEKWEYPLEAVREAIVNAIAHRDYTITVVDIELSIYSNRMEIISPGRLPNTVTVEKMRAGYRASRNELLKEVLRDYQYIESTGLGVPRKIIKGMLEHNGTSPDLVEEDDRFTVRLWSGK
jgi:ATP-dependent DNA helicase RecG